MKYRYMLKDIRKQLILDRETYFEFGPRIMCYFEWNKKTLEDIARQKTISIDTCVLKVGVKPEDIAAYPFRRLTNEARAAPPGGAWGRPPCAHVSRRILTERSTG